MPLRGITLIEVLIVIGIITVLASLLLVGTQAARSSMLATNCGENMRQLGIAIASYNTSHGLYPPGVVSSPGSNSRFGWGAMLLPYMELSSLHAQIDFEDSLLSQGNAIAVQAKISAFGCPADPAELSTIRILSPARSLGRSNFVGCRGYSDDDGVFFPNSGVRSEDVLDGLGCTMFVSERSGKTAWAGEFDGETIRVLYSGSEPISYGNSENGVSSFHSSGCHVLMGDGTVVNKSRDVDGSVWAAMASREGNSQ
ncbi:DUF1559 domain-containing protein [bacterium]|nr:DUF1559 domain-containing protein [bacterium]